MGQYRTIYGMALLYAVTIGFSFLFTKRALLYADPVDTMAFRFALSLLVIALPVMTGRIKLGLRRGDWLRLLPVGFLYPTVFFGFQAYGLTFTTSSEAGIYQATSPIFTLVLAGLLLKERASRTQKLAVLGSVSGVIFIMAMSGASVQGASLSGAGLLCWYRPSRFR